MISLIWRDTKKNVELISKSVPCAYAIDYMPADNIETAYISTDKQNVDYKEKEAFYLSPEVKEVMGDAESRGYDIPVSLANMERME